MTQRGKAKIKLTADSVKQLQTDDPRGHRVSDSDLSGFGITVYPSGKKTFWCRYGPRNRRRFTTIGNWGKLTADQARTKAKELLAEATLGNDPIQEEKRLRRVPTFSDWVADYLRQAKQEQKKNTFWKTRWLLARANEFFGGKALDELTRNDIQDARLDIAENRGNRTANRWTSAVRTCLTEAVARGHIIGNPATGIKKLREGPPRQRVLSAEEMERLQAALAEVPNVYVRTAFWLLIGTGARRSEVLQARWEHIDLERATWRLPDTKSGKPQTILLSPSLVEMLRVAPRIQGSPWVIPSWRWPQKHKGDLHREWATLCQEAKIESAVVHDLRRTFGKRIAEQAGLHIASKLLRHADVSTTAAVYAPIDESTLRAAVQGDSNVISFPNPIEGAAES